MKEQELVNLVISYLTLAGHFVWRNNSGVVKAESTNRYGQHKTRMWRAGLTGSSDVLGVSKNGKFIAIECKIGKNKPTLHQEVFLEEVNKRGGIAVVAYDIKDIEFLCKREG